MLEKDFQLILNSVPLVILLVDTNLNIEYSNLAAQEFLKLNKDKLQFKNLADTFYPDSILIDTILRTKKEKKTMSIENFNLSSPYFSYSGINASISIIEGAGVEKFIVTINNTSFKKRLESQYFISNNNVSFLGLSKMLAHEIKNPLSGIKGSAQLLSVEVDKDKKELTDIIIQETDRVNNIIKKIEYLFSNDLIDSETINIHEIIDQSIKISQASYAKTIIFEKKYDPSLPLISGNKNLLIQAILNLIKNSSEAIIKEGKIVFSTYFSLWEPKEKYLGKEKRITPIHVEISDNGEGISDFLKETLFNPFITSKNHGSGLGLTQVIGAMNSHGGTAEYIQSKSNTTFRLSFPEMIKKNE